MERDELRVIPLTTAGNETERVPLLRKLGEPVLEVNNDHFPTAIFQRRIVEVLDPSGQRCLALEDDMSLLRLEPVGTERKATVASIRDADKFAALNRVLGETGFDAILEAKRKYSGKAREDFSIVIKPNFMFAYDKRDRSTYTDPGLVLIREKVAGSRLQEPERRRGAVDVRGILRQAERPRDGRVSGLRRESRVRGRGHDIGRR